MASHDLLSLLQNTFGFAGFRANQKAVCEASAAGHDVLLVMPTGAGKSLCYQLPALARGGTALVISPLIALMDDQAAKLTKLGLRVGRIHSGLDREQSRQVCRDYLDGRLQFLLIAPERLRVPGFVDMLRKGRLALIAVDEAHCISQWGHDFRPDYRNLARHIEALRPAPVIALTATATPAVQKDIVSELRLQDARLFIHGFRRTNLAVEVAEASKPRRAEMTEKLLAARENRPAIVYAPSRKDAEELAARLNARFPTAAYHAGLPAATREAVQGRFLDGRLEVVVATVAFGMGIDKADVRTVVHAAMPASVESYYQEIGRAGRDCAPARAVLLYSYQDRRMHDWFLERDYPPADTLSRIAARLAAEPVHADDLRIALKLDMETFAPALDKLLAQGAAEIDFGGNVVATGVARADWRRGYEAQVNFRRTQIDAMMRFAEGTNCRMAALIRHFGDRSDGAQTCGLCDVCAPAGASAQTTREPTEADEREMLRILRELGDGRSRSTGKLYTELCSGKGAMDRKAFDGLLDALSRAGYLSLASETFTNPEGRDVTYRKATATYEGREVANGAPLVNVTVRESAAAEPRKRTSSPARAERAAKAQAEEDMQPLSAGQKAAAAALKAWRAQTAAALQQPAFCVFSDRVLRNIAREEPRSLADLLEISGLGKVKVERWGAEMLRVLSEPSEGLPAATPRPGTTVRTKQTSTPGAAASAAPAATAFAPRAQAAAGAGTLEYALKVWRMRAAAEMKVAPFVLMLDSTVRAVAEALPTTPQALGRVRGMAAEVVATYGAEICAVVRPFAAAPATGAAGEPTARAAVRGVLPWPQTAATP